MRLCSRLKNAKTKDYFSLHKYYEPIEIYLYLVQTNLFCSHTYFPNLGHNKYTLYLHCFLLFYNIANSSN